MELQEQVNLRVVDQFGIEARIRKRGRADLLEPLEHLVGRHVRGDVGVHGDVRRENRVHLGENDVRALDVRLSLALAFQRVDHALEYFLGFAIRQIVDGAVVQVECLAVDVGLAGDGAHGDLLDVAAAHKLVECVHDSLARAQYAPVDPARRLARLNHVALPFPFQYARVNIIYM